MDQAKTYTNKSNANRAGKKQFGEGNYTIEQSELGFVIIHNEIVKTPAKPTIIQGVPYVQFSTIVRPCKQVWHIADSMPNATRKQVLKACIDAGIAFYTARTQYQQWSAVQKEMQSREAEQDKNIVNA